MSNTRIITCALAAAGALFIGSHAKAQAPGQIFACVNNRSGTIHVVAPNTSCHSNETLLNWNVVGPQGPAGPAGPAGPVGPAGPQGTALGASAFNCPTFSTFTTTLQLHGDDGPYIPGVSFGSGISYANGDTFVLQPGIYQLHLRVDGVSQPSEDAAFAVQINVNGNRVGVFAGVTVPVFDLNAVDHERGSDPPSPVARVAGEELLQVSVPNTTVSFTKAPLFVNGYQLLNGCSIIFTRLE